MADAFLSYSREDQNEARRFAESLQREGFTVWWDQSLRSGENYDQVTERALQEARAVIVLWSRHSVDSRWVRAEATQADRNGTLMPVMIEACNRPIMFELKHTVDLSGWRGDAQDPSWRRFVADLRETLGREPAGSQQDPVSRPSHPRRWMIPVIGLLALLTLGAGLWLAFGRDVPEQAVARAASGPVTLAVLPFANLSTDAQQEYFSDGLTEEILNQLAQIKDLRVTGRTSSFSFKGRNEDLRAIAGKLGVDNLLEGSVRRDGDDLRITAQLIDGRDGSHRWSRTYATQSSQRLQVQENIAKDVAQALSVKLSVGDWNPVSIGTRNPEAFDRFLRARDVVFKGQGGNQEAAQSVALLREALALDPDFVRGWYMLDQTLFASVQGRPGPEVQAVYAERVKARERVAALAPGSPPDLAGRVDTLLRERRWAEADAASDALYSKFPVTAGNLEFSGARIRTLMITGRVDEMLRIMQQGRTLDPLGISFSRDLQLYLDGAGRSEEAQEEYLKSFDIPGNRLWVEQQTLLRMLNDGRSGRAELQSQFRRIQDAGRPPPYLASLVAAASDRQAMRNALREQLGVPANAPQLRTPFTYTVADALGDSDLALTVLGNMVADENAYRIWQAPFSGLRAEPRFKQILREMGLAEFFRSTGLWSDYCKPVGADDFECR